MRLEHWAACIHSTLAATKQKWYILWGVQCMHEGVHTQLYIMGSWSYIQTRVKNFNNIKVS